MDALCLLLGMACMAEPVKMPVHKPPPLATTKLEMPRIAHPPRLNIAKIQTTDPFPKDCEAQPPTPKLRRAYVDAARRHRGATACDLAKQGKAESGFDPKAVSPVGAIGIAQFLPATAKEWGVDPWDARASIFAQARYMRWCRARWTPPPAYGRTDKDMRALSLSSYNWGVGSMRKSQARNGWTLYREAKPHLPRETRDYVRKIEGK